MHAKRKNQMPDPALGNFELESFLPYRLSLLSNTVSEAVAKTYREDFDIGVTEWRVIAVLGRFPGVSARDVMDRTAMDKVAVSRAVRRLQENGMIERSAHETDRRRLRLRLTADSGARIFREIGSRAKRYEHALLKNFSLRELAQLDRLLCKLQRTAKRTTLPSR
jgi:DNA-binding MarR family transcriptional regulator